MMTFKEWIERRHPETLEEANWKHTAAMLAGLAGGGMVDGNAPAADATAVVSGSEESQREKEARDFRQNTVYRTMMQFGWPGHIPEEYANKENTRWLSQSEKKAIEREVFESMKKQFGGIDEFMKAMDSIRRQKEKEVEEFRKNTVYRTMIQFGWEGDIPREYEYGDDTRWMSQGERKAMEREVFNSLKSKFGGIDGFMDLMRKQMPENERRAIERKALEL